MRVDFLKTELIGTLAAVWDIIDSGFILKQLTFLKDNFSEKDFLLSNGFSAVSSHFTDTFFENILHYLAGEAVSFSLDRLDFSNVTDFRMKVYETLFATSSGEIITYGDLAAKAGFENASRAVGTAMKLNPFPIIIPCHRVIRSGGVLGNYGGGVDVKRKLLEIENSEFFSFTAYKGKKT